MADFLLELLSEEVPARMQAKARNDLARMMAEALAAAGLTHDGITTYSTPRRLALIAKNLPLETAAVSEELKGPKTAAPQQALDGFLRKTGLSQDQLQDRDGIWFAVIDRPGGATADVLAETVAAIVRDFQWPKSMRWGAASASTASLRWVRPLHSIVALLGEQIVDVQVDGVTCGASTLGHRFHHPGPITIGGAHDYVEKLRACHVLVDQQEREAIVRDRAIQLAEEAGFALVQDEGLVVENAGLTEWPVPLLGSFDPDYLDVPPEVIQLTARTNQKYFVMRKPPRDDQTVELPPAVQGRAGGMTDRLMGDHAQHGGGVEGALAPHFICTANIDANDGGAAIVAGNERVLAARLSDARFFWQQDLKIPFVEQAKKLEQIVFHEKLGTVADKVERVAKLAEWLVIEGIVKGCSPADAKRAAELCKADLVTGMVGEFPELQGIIGGHLARAQGEPDAIADAIRDHYKPVGQGDDVPTAPVTVAVSLADKLDSIAAFFAAEMFPTGSKDPFALRRSMLGVINQIIETGARLNFIKFSDYAGLDSGASAWLFDFLDERLRAQQKAAGTRHDIFEAVFDNTPDADVVRLLARVKALQAFVETGEGANLLAGYKRAANILKKERWDAAAVSGGASDEVEVALIAALIDAEPAAREAIGREDFTAAMSALASLRAPIDAFFDGVMINDPDPAIRARRLGLLARFRDAVHAVADFSKIEG